MNSPQEIKNPKSIVLRVAALEARFDSPEADLFARQAAETLRAAGVLPRSYKFYGFLDGAGAGDAESLANARKGAYELDRHLVSVLDAPAVLAFLERWRLAEAYAPKQAGDAPRTDRAPQVSQPEAHP
jgi:hypothetical protein